MEQLSTKDMVWLRASLQEFKNPPKHIKEAIVKLDQFISNSILNIKQNRVELT